MNDSICASAAQTARAIRARQVSSERVVEACLERIGAVNPQLNAVVQTDGTAALRRAREADVALDRGVVWGPLHGVPMTIKDSFETAGMVTTAGTMGLAHHVPAAMLFVPSRGGISHSPAEFTPAEQCELGSRVLTRAVRALVS